MKTEGTLDPLPVCSILFVEDNYDDFELMEMQLAEYRQVGLILEHTDCLASAAKRLRSGGIDIIFLDLSLPDSQGIATVKGIRLAAPTTPIIVLSGTSDMTVALEALKHGAEDYLIKGCIDNALIWRSINYAMARHAARLVSERLATIVDSLDDAVIGKTLNGTITSWNRGASKIFGYSEEEVSGKSIAMLMPEDASAELELILKAIANGESIRNMEIVGLNKSGGRVHISATISPIVSEDGTISGAAVIDRDITERKQSQKVLEASEERYRVLVTGVKDYAIVMLDPNGIVQSWNEGGKRVKGYEAAEIIGQHFSVFYKPEDRQQGLPDFHLQSAITNGSFEGRGWRMRKDGSCFFADVVITPILAADGELRGFTKIDRDITERMKAEQEIADGRLRLSLALDSAAIGVWDYDLIENTVWRSLSHDKIFGYQELMPLWNMDVFLSHVIPEDVAVAKEAYKAGLKAGNLRAQIRITRASDKSIRWISVRGETYFNEEGSPLRMLGTIADISDIKERDEEKRLLSIMMEREDFMATLTHDMKNPLIAAKRLLELFVAGKLGELTGKQLQLLRALEESNAGLLELIADLLEVYHFEKDVNILSEEECDLTALVSSCVSRILPFAELRSVKLTAHLPDQLLAIVDVSRMTRVVKNLLENALKFVQDGGNIIVRLFKQGLDTIIEIEDNGVGILPEEHSLLFQRFSQGHAGKRYSGGSGLGLYLCKQIVAAHGGTIDCKSVPNQATTFTVSLPTGENGRA